MTTSYLYKATFTDGTERKILASSFHSEFDAYANAFSKLSTQERDSLSSLILEEDWE